MYKQKTVGYILLFSASLPAGSWRFPSRLTRHSEAFTMEGKQNIVIPREISSNKNRA